MSNSVKKKVKYYVANLRGFTGKFFFVCMKLEILKMPPMKRERNYLKRLNMQDARVWFRYRCKITTNIKGNKSSMYKDNIGSRLCNSGGNCNFTK